MQTSATIAEKLDPLTTLSAQYRCQSYVTNSADVARGTSSAALCNICSQTALHHEQMAVLTDCALHQLAIEC